MSMLPEQKMQLYRFSVCCMLLTLIQCATPKPHITYNIPKGYPEAKRIALIEKLDKGKELYKQYCSDCHGIFHKGVDSVPNFSNAQIDNYSARFMRKDPKNHAVIAKMSNEQMNEILNFLRYKRPDSSKPRVKLNTDGGGKHWR